MKTIDITKLTEADIARKVVYQSHPGAEFEEGRITSFNDRFVFVDYTNAGRGQATDPRMLQFIAEE